jgi:hypothetical protein
MDRWDKGNECGITKDEKKKWQLILRKAGEIFDHRSYLSQETGKLPK